MIQISGPDEDESLKKNNPVIHYRFKRKIEFLNCHLQLYIAEDKLKIIVNCIEEYSDEYKEYSNYFSLYQLQELSKYFNFFEKIEDILEDMANILKLNNYDIEKNLNTLTLILHVAINDEFGDVHLSLFRNKSFNNNAHKNPSQIIQNIKNNDNRKKIIYKPQNNQIETEISRGGSTIGVKSIKELNKLLTDLKDRITVLEVTQNTSQNQNQNKQFKNKGIFNNNIPNSEKFFSIGSSSLTGNENIILSMDSILRRINKLEEANSKKTEKIKYLQEKLKVYEPMMTTSENDSIKDNNGFNFNNYNNMNDYNIKQNSNNNFINLGSIKKKDTNTINSNNTNLNNTLLEIKEELNSSSSSKNRNKSKSKSRNKNIKNKDNNINKSEKKNKIKDKDKDKDKKNKSKSKSKSKNKNKKDSLTPNSKRIENNYNKDNNENLEYFKNNNNIKNTKKKSKSKNKERERERENENEKKLKNVNEEIICTDIDIPKNNNQIKTIVHEMDENDSLKLINNLENNLRKKNEDNIVKKKTISKIRDSNQSKDKSLNEYNLKPIKTNTRSTLSINKDNNENENINLNNNNNNNINTNINNIENSQDINNKKIDINKSNNIDNIDNIDIKDENINKDNNNSNIENNSNENKNIEKNKDINNKKNENKKEIKEKESKESSYETSEIENKKKIKKIKKKLPIIEKENIRKYVNSEIIFTKNELRALKTKVNHGDKKFHVFFDLLYRATDDGDNSEEAKKKVKDIMRTLTLFYTVEGARFGIYVEKEIRYTIFGKSLKEKPGSSFLISLNYLDIYDILDYNIVTENKSDMLCFIKNKKKDINGSNWSIFTPPKDFLGKLCILGEINNYFDVEDLEDIIGEKTEYHLKQVEIFDVAIEEEGEYDYNQVIENQNDSNENETNNKLSDIKEDNKEQQESFVSSNDNYSNFHKKKRKNRNEEFYMSGIIKGINDK